MKRSIFTATASAVSLSLAIVGTAFADDDNGWYLRANAGLGVHTDTDLTGQLTSRIHEDTGMQSESDLAYSLGLGYDFSNNWRLELDGDQLFTNTGAISNTPNSFSKLRTSSLMLNAIYDFSNNSRFEPYVGAGAGFVRGQGTYAASDLIANDIAIAHPACIADRGTLVSGNNASLAHCAISDQDTSFGWQVLAGLGVDITDNLVWDTHATYQDAGTFNFEGDVTLAGADGSTTINPITTQLSGAGLASLMTGLRYRFGGTADATPPPPPPPPPPVTFTCADGSVVMDRALCPPPPPPPPPPVSNFTCDGSGQVVTDLALCPPRTECPDGSVVYGPASFCPVMRPVANCVSPRQEIIYYEFDRAQSAETRNAINRILDVGQFCQVDAINVVGHTDTSGSRAYNQNLSVRRANDAVEELVRQGVARATISAEGKGETQPFVPTGDGVREQLNRRTEVLLTISEVAGIN